MNNFGSDTSYAAFLQGEMETNNNPKDEDYYALGTGTNRLGITVRCDRRGDAWQTERIYFLSIGTV